MLCENSSDVGVGGRAKRREEFWVTSWSFWMDPFLTPASGVRSDRGRSLLAYHTAITHVQVRRCLHLHSFVLQRVDPWWRSFGHRKLFEWMSKCLFMFDCVWKSWQRKRSRNINRRVARCSLIESASFSFVFFFFLFRIEARRRRRPDYC